MFNHICSLIIIFTLPSLPILIVYSLESMLHYHSTPNSSIALFLSSCSISWKNFSPGKTQLPAFSMPVLLQLKIIGEEHSSSKLAFSSSGPLKLAVPFSCAQKKLFHSCTFPIFILFIFPSPFPLLGFRG